MAKKEVDRVVYKAVLSFLDESIEVYSDLLSLAEEAEEKDASRYSDILDACNDIKKSFLSLYKPKKLSQNKDSAAKTAGREAANA